MTELHWPPAAIGGLTPSQLVCLLSEKPPWSRPIKSLEEYEARAAEEAEAENAWCSS